MSSTVFCHRCRRWLAPSCIMGHLRDRHLAELLRSNARIFSRDGGHDVALAPSFGRVGEARVVRTGG